MDKFVYYVPTIATFVVLTGLIALVGYPLFKSIASDGKIQYCYVESERTMVPNQGDVVVYTLYGFRPWRIDRRISPVLASLDLAKETAVKYGCELR